MTYVLDRPAGENLRLQISTGVEAPDRHRWPGDPKAGMIPAMVVRQLAPDLGSIKVHSTTPKPPRGTGWSIPHRGRHRWTVPAGVSAFDVVWTVPYRGDSYYSRGPRDCSCGEPWGFSIFHTLLHVTLGRTWLFDPRTPLQLEVINLSGAALPLRQRIGGKASTRWIARGAATRWTLLHPDRPGPISLRVRMGAGYPDDSERRAAGWSRSWFSCRSTPDIGPESEVEVVDSMIRRARFTCRKHGGQRWVFSLPKMLQRRKDSEVDWFIRGKFRELINPAMVSTYPQWPALSWLRVLPGVKVSSSSQLQPGTRRYAAANLVDGKPQTAWCERRGRGTRPAVISYQFDAPTRLRGLALLPGMVKAGWLYEANAAPRRVRLRWVDQRGEAHQVMRGLNPPTSSTLMFEGQEILWVELAATVSSLEVSFPEVRSGRLSSDLCVSEMVPVGQT